LTGFPAGRGLNIASEAVVRHAAGERSGREALRLVRADGAVRPLSYADLTGQTNGTIALRDRIRPLAILKDSWP
jgi:acetyl-CoA synthetase